MASLKERWPLSALYNNNNFMDEISNFRDKTLQEYIYRVKNTNISTLKKQNSIA